MVNNINSFLLENNFEVIYIEYGKYINTKYINILKTCIFSVFISESESQGISMFESWSCDVPTFVWKNNFSVIINSKIINYHSTSPYLCSDNGIFFNDYKDFIEKFTFYKHNSSKFKPRDFILNNFTDSHSTKYLLSKLQKHE